MEWGLLGGIVVWACALCRFDVRERRLPNALTLPAAVIAVATGVVEPRLLAGIAVWAGLYLVVFLLGGLGAGDVKLAVPLGALVAGLAGPVAVLAAVLAAQLLTLAWALGSRGRTVPHAPAMFAGAAAAVLLGA